MEWTCHSFLLLYEAAYVSSKGLLHGFMFIYIWTTVSAVDNSYNCYMGSGLPWNDMSPGANGK